MKEGGYHLWEKSDWDLIQLGDMICSKENKKYESCCGQNEWKFDYHGIKKALCGKITYKENELKSERFTPKRILVIQMK